MKWLVHFWVWQLKAPLFIGMPPAGALNRCRIYVPARNIWGALTSELARLRCKDSFPGAVYKEVGNKITSSCRFTYLYPAQEVNGKFLAWLPEYERGRGLVWRFQGGGDPVPDRKFRQLLVDTRPGTAIEPQTGSAVDRTLREMEYINPWWRKLSSCENMTKPVYLAGYFFIKQKDSNLKGDISNIITLSIGGDTRYGLGKISRVRLDDVTVDEAIFGREVDLTSEDPRITSGTVLGHALLEEKEESIDTCGMKELLGGWNCGTPCNGNLMWVPGSVFKGKQHKGKQQVSCRIIDKEGHWSCSAQNI